MKLSVKEMVQISFFSALAVAGTLMLRFGGEVLVPFSIMPLVVMLAGTLLGARNGAMSMLIYMLLGLASVPVFQKLPYGGLSYVFQPTFGFIIGYIAAAFVVGLIAHRRDQMPTRLRLFLAMLAGLVVLYAIGLPYLYLMVNFYLGKSMPVAIVIAKGFTPFILFDLIKAGIATLIGYEVLQRIAPAAEKPAPGWR